MKVRLKRILSLLMAMMLVVSCFAAFHVSAEDGDDEEVDEELAEYVDDGHMNLDIVFVLDASGSMLYSDPNGVALDAMNLFLDLCDDSCGVGYDVYTQKIMEEQEIKSIKEKSDFDDIKNKIGKIKYDPSGDTDIALGLTKAKQIFEKNEKKDANRKKAIILLSDGNTDLPNGPRTVDESKKEMETTLAELDKKGIPVYAIGLNHNDKLDKKELDDITKKTGGKAYETKSSDGLTLIASDIFSDIYDLEGVDREIINGDVKIPIKDNSVFYVNIIIRTKLTLEEMSPRLTDPDGKNVSLTGSDNIKMTSAGSYTLIKLIYPQSGTWILHLSKANSDNCSVKQLDFYSVFIDQEIPKKAVIGDEVLITASLNDGNGIVKDSDLLKTIEMTATVKHSSWETEVKLERNNDGTFTGTFVAEHAGEHTVKTTAVSDKFKKSSAKKTIDIFLKTQDAGETSGTDEEDGGELQAFIMVLIVGVGIVVLVIVALIIASVIRTSAEEKKVKEVRPEEPPKPRPQPQPVAKPVQKETPPDYVNVTLVEHDALENLIKKGTDDAFSTKNADEFKADENLEKLIKKGADDPFHANASDYTVDPSLAALIRTGGDGLGVGKEEESYDDDDEYDDDDYDDDDYDE